MSPRSDYFLARRRRLRRQHRCTRCGSERAAAGHTLCPACMVVMKAKAAPRRSEAAEKAQDAKRKRLQHRLDLIEEARQAVLSELDRCA